jgi:hypothetical protein
MAIRDGVLKEIRLPLQIGNSALWSLARASAAFPGLAIVVLGGWLMYALADADKTGFEIAFAVMACGGLLLYYAWVHARLAMEERPSDVILDADGLRIEGGARDGLAIAWSEIGDSRCRLQHEVEERLTAGRLLMNLPLMVISMVAEVDATRGMTEKAQVSKLLVVTKSGDATMVAEGDLAIERNSLEQLAATIRSGRWYGGDAGSHKSREKKSRQGPGPGSGAPANIACSNCGAVVAPTSEPDVACRFCGVAVRIPEEVRQRVAAASELASRRRTGMAHLERLLESQPSARFANLTMWLAAFPIALAWPLSAGLLLWEAFHDALTLKQAAALLVLPLLLTFGAFLLARGRLTDRFALHAVVIGFGARDPVRPGEPYRCRACDAALPGATGTPVVHCLYCNQASVLGLDLRGDAHEASQEHASLERALADRSSERWLWRLASLGSIALLVGAFFIVRSSMHVSGLHPRKIDPSENFAFAEVTTTTGNPPRSLGGKVGWVLRFSSPDRPDRNCRATLSVGSDTVYERSGTCRFRWGRPTTFDEVVPARGDMKLRADLRAKVALLTGVADGSAWEVRLKLDN